MLNWSTPIAPGHPLKRKFAQAYPDQVLPEETVPGITKVLYEFHDTIAELQRRFLRIIAEGIGCHETFFDEMVADGPTLTRAIRYPPMAESPEGAAPATRVGRRARRHQPDHRPAAGHGARAAGQGRRRLGRRRRARRPGDHQHRDHARTADQRADPDRLAPRRRRARLTRASATASCSSATPGRGRSCRRCRAAARRTRRSGSTPCPPPTPSTRCSTRSTSSRTPGACDDRRSDTGLYLDEPTEQLEPPRQLAPAILAIDIGGTQFAAGLVTTKGELVDRS